jgi:hypothetical protein
MEEKASCPHLVIPFRSNATEEGHSTPRIDEGCPRHCTSTRRKVEVYNASFDPMQQGGVIRIPATNFYLRWGPLSSIDCNVNFGTY